MTEILSHYHSCIVCLLCAVTIYTLLLFGRNTEAAFIEERDSTAEGQEWERVARICEFNPKNNKSTKDASRLRSILLHLKQEGLVR